ncbi:MAG: cobalamin biosynthesis protein CobD [SAR86 cluster bacterium]|uniref:Cobalamin biosynthesis protein CobD n=1 Tax=SAR86 cluster bacterium TaxID=2030880 RepID=A0A2A4MGB1_9GAMM|nr:MAG: cobalamin biosynthesis protein CobD [SAR86 cluster bacterium]
MIFGDLSLIQITVSILLALCLDRTIGEVSRWHPLVLWGGWVVKLEKQFNGGRYWQGVFAWAVVVIPVLSILGIILWLSSSYSMAVIISSICLYFSIAWRSLREHGLAVMTSLNIALPPAQQAVARIVSRDTSQMTRVDVIRATIESMLENGADAIFAPLFWFLIAGPFGAVGYRLVNTLDAMWGYRTKQYNFFGAFAARADDVLNYLPARLTALSYSLLGNTASAFSCWRRQAPACISPNAGPVMCAGAGSLEVCLGGGASYNGRWCEKPLMGSGREDLNANDIERSISLVDRSVITWTLILVGCTVAFSAAEVMSGV